MSPLPPAGGSTNLPMQLNPFDLYRSRASKEAPACRDPLATARAVLHPTPDARRFSMRSTGSGPSRNPPQSTVRDVVAGGDCAGAGGAEDAADASTSANAAANRRAPIRRRDITSEARAVVAGSGAIPRRRCPGYRTSGCRPTLRTTGIPPGRAAHGASRASSDSRRHSRCPASPRRMECPS